MAEYPLVFKVTHEIPSGDFTARVVMQGRALMVQEDGAWWCHGVEPGGLTESGDQPAPAFAAFKVALGQILDQMAEDAGSLDEFRGLVKRFVTESSDDEQWEEARRQIREGSVEVEEPFKAMKREKGQVGAWAVVMRLEQIEEAEDEVALAGVA